MLNITFSPVSCARGRKWRGPLAFDVGTGARAGTWGTMSKKLWDPASRKWVYANQDFLEKVELEPEKLEAAKLLFVEWLLADTVAWCQRPVFPTSPVPTPAEAKQHARSYLLKFFPGLADLVEERLPDQRDLVSEIEKTLTWAMDLKTRPMFMYGHWCPGGKPLPTEKKVRIALRALQNKHLTKDPNFQEIWEFLLADKQLPNVQ